MTDPQAFRVALTGGIASGKTAVANEFARLGVPVIDTDQISRDIYLIGSPTLARIAAEFGVDVLQPDGSLNRARMREVIFAEPGKRKQLEAITHPAIRAELTRRAETVAGPYQIHAIPLLVETGQPDAYDRVLVVDCPEEMQIARLMQRDGVDSTQANRALAAQATRTARRAIATDIIENAGNLDELHQRVAELHAQFLKLAKLRQIPG
ncbi:MAG TPA: dephospho-CoA kinase [Steroidobacteraceae bacterium]|nr:dephospho-CoA kinase [Steroidobacteraceae bacterium]